MADESLLRQVFINLTKNAIEAEANTIGLRWDNKLYFSNYWGPQADCVVVSNFHE